jgi:hypothetical protein
MNGLLPKLVGLPLPPPPPGSRQLEAEELKGDPPLQLLLGALRREEPTTQLLPLQWPQAGRSYTLNAVQSPETLYM